MLIFIFFLVTQILETHFVNKVSSFKRDEKKEGGLDRSILEWHSYAHVTDEIWWGSFSHWHGVMLIEN